ncbi:MAG: hypothetical protein U1F23_12825 [Lysobacterales bacterium]
MSVLIPMPVEHLGEEQLRILEWELVMAGGFGTRAQCRVRAEIDRRLREPCLVAAGA